MFVVTSNQMYKAECNAVKRGISFPQLMENAEHNVIVVADRFPFRYFVDEYGLNYYAAFPGCSEQTEAGSKTIAFLINKAKSDNIKTILKIELTSDKLAKSIAEEAGAKVMTLNAAHNISSEDFEKDVEKTYRYFSHVLRNMPTTDSAFENDRGGWKDLNTHIAYTVYNVNTMYDETGSHYIPDETITVFQFNTWTDDMEKDFT
mgnify:CR=1 FL=1